MLPGPDGVWGMPADMVKTLPGYGGGCSEKPGRSPAQSCKRLGYGPDKRLPVKISTRNLAVYRDPAAF